MSRSEILRMAYDLEEAAKTEEIVFVTVKTPDGFIRSFSRYLLPYVAEGLRKEAEL